jgi:hypothetical protein
MKKLIIIGVFSLISIGAFAQENYGYILWNYQVPLSNREWLSDNASRGGAVGYRVFIGDGKRVSIGGEFSWTTFTQYTPKETFVFPDGALTTDYYKYIYNYSAVLNTQYNFLIGERGMVLPYVGIGLGANRNTYTLYYNIYTDEAAAWGFLARPEAGIAVRFSERRSLGAMAAIHYDYSTNKNAEYGYKNFTALGFKVGLVLMGR